MITLLDELKYHGHERDAVARSRKDRDRLHFPQKLHPSISWVIIQDTTLGIEFAGQHAVMPATVHITAAGQNRSFSVVFSRS